MGIGTCMAGLAETCSHIAAILYWLKTTVHAYSDTITKVALPNTSCSNEDIKTAEKSEHLALNHAMSNHAVITCLYICINRKLAKLATLLKC